MFYRFVCVFLSFVFLTVSGAEAAPYKWRNKTPAPAKPAPVTPAAPAPPADPEKAAFYKELQAIKDRWQTVKSTASSIKDPAGAEAAVETLLSTSYQIIADFKKLREASQNKANLPVSEIEYPLVDMYLFESDLKRHLKIQDWESSVDTALNVYPGNAYALRTKLAGLLNQGKKDEALAFLESQLPDYASGKKTSSFLIDPLNTVINVLMQEKNHEKANTLMTAAVSMAPDARKRDFLYLQSKVLSVQAKYSEALTAVDSALALHTYPPAYLKELKATLLIQLNKKSEAAALLEDLLGSGYEQDKLKYIFTLATAYLDLQQQEKAAEALKKVHSVEKVPSSAWQPLIDLAKKLDDTSALIGIYAKYRTSTFIPGTLYLQDEVNLMIGQGDSGGALEVLKSVQHRISGNQQLRDWVDAKIQVLAVTGQ